MKKSVAAAFLTLWFMAGIAGALAVPTKTPASGTTSPKDFVQSFYNWYVFKKDNEADVKGMDAVLKEKRQLLDATLCKQLQEDQDAADKAPGEIVGLDFDPFVAAN